MSFLEATATRGRLTATALTVMLNLEIEISDQMCSTVLFLPEMGNITTEEAQRETERMDYADNSHNSFTIYET